MWGMTPPPAMVALIRVSSSSSPLMASYKCLGVILFTFKSLLAFPANSNTSAVKYSKIAAAYTAEVAPTLLFALTLLFKNLWILPTGNYKQSHINTTIPLQELESYLKSCSGWSWLGSFLWFSASKFASFSAFSCLMKNVEDGFLLRRILRRTQDLNRFV